MVWASHAVSLVRSGETRHQPFQIASQSLLEWSSAGIEGTAIASITIRKLDDEVKIRLRVRDFEDIDFEIVELWTAT